MHVTCEGCGVSVKRSGIKNHIHFSQDPRCKSHGWKGLESNKIPSIDIAPPDLPLPTMSGLSNDEKIPVDPAGDFFGDYMEYADDDDLAAAEVRNEDENEEEDEEDLLDAGDAEQEGGLEPLREPSPIPPFPTDELQDDTQQPALRLRGGAEEGLQKKPFIVEFPRSTAGAIYSQSGRTVNEQYTRDIGSAAENPFAPFLSQLEWEVAQWAKLRGPSSTAFTELMEIDGVAEKLGLSFKSAKGLNQVIDHMLPGRPHFQRHEVLIGDEVCEVFFRDIIACIRALLGDPDFAVYLIFVPEKHYTDGAQTVRMYHDMHTGKWWWSTQEALEKDKPGATIIPIIISTDKTQLTLFRNKSAYPIYMTIGNIPKEIRRKPSNRAYVLLGYLPTTRLENVTNKSARRRLLANLYHACMARVLAPLRSAGKDGIHMTTSDALIRRCHPLLACVVTDYPEQVLTTCTYTGECPSCDKHRDELGDYDRDGSSELRDLDKILEIIDSFDTNPAGFLQACKQAGVKPVVDPFWKDLPYVHIYRSITPNVLHQLYQGIMKHLIRWIIEAYGAPEIDARCRRMPPNHNIRLFIKGISTLSRVTGQEHDQMCRILLGLIIDAPLPGGRSSARLLSAVRAMLDFLYLAQYPIHTDKTLELLEDALEDFHKNKAIFIDLGIRDSFNIPKLHWAEHYANAIRLYGTTDNVNTQYTERLHIDLAKQAYAATNRKDEFAQMTMWLERKEKILRHAQYVKWRCDGSPAVEEKAWTPPGLELDRTLGMAKHPSLRAVPFEDISEKYGASFFLTALRRYVVLTNEPNLTPHQLERRLWSVRIPFRKVPVWHRIKFLRSDPASTHLTSTADSIHVRPARKDGRNRVIPGRFDTALVNDGTGDTTGIEGHRIGRVRVVFSLPEKSHTVLFTNDDVVVPKHLAYVEWYSALRAPERHHGLHRISPLKDREGGRICSIIPLANIRRSIHLFPKFGRVAPAEWTSSNVLDMCSTFFVNTFTDRQLYRIIY
ncbi:hypothetical protein FPV67DRAFT_1566591 [Lyophyllum atratum]|nr:hypothetical protein FPV67DRAFT_1566591 [Lyophyllum atratum]